MKSNSENGTSDKCVKCYPFISNLICGRPKCKSECMLFYRCLSKNRTSSILTVLVNGIFFFSMLLYCASELQKRKEEIYAAFMGETVSKIVVQNTLGWK